MKKKLLALGLAGMMMLGALAGCGGSGDTTPPADNAGDAAQADDGGNAAASDMKIGLSMSSRDQFLSTLETAVLEDAKAAGVTCNSFDANNDIQQQLNHVQTCAADGYSAMIVNLVDSTNAQEIINAAGDMKVVFVNRSPDTALLSDDVMFVGSNEEDSGSFQGEFLANYFKEKGMNEVSIVMMQGTLGLDHTNKRTEFSIKGLEDAGIKVNIAYQDTAEYDRAKAMDKFTQFLGTGKHYDAIVSNNDDMALGCIEAITSTGAKVEVPVLGVDATEGACMAIKEGTMSMSASQNGYAMGRGCVDSAIALIEGKAPEGLTDEVMVPIPFEQIDASNVDDMLKQLESAS